MAGSRIDPRKLRKLKALSKKIVDLSWQLAVTGIDPVKPPKPKHELLARIHLGAKLINEATRKLK